MKKYMLRHYIFDEYDSHITIGVFDSFDELIREHIKLHPFRNLYNDFIEREDYFLTLEIIKPNNIKVVYKGNNHSFE